MATAFYIRKGYSWGHSDDIELDEIMQIARDIDIDVFRGKVIEYDYEGKFNLKENLEYMESFILRYSELPSEDVTFKYTTTIDGESHNEDEGQIVSMASGGGLDRYIKEVVRRAFCWLVMDECLKRGKAVSFVIA